MEQQNRKLPAIKELFADKEMVIRQDEFNHLVNHTPPAEWVKVHPFAKINYIPIERIEWLLNRICYEWWVEIKEVKSIAHSVCVAVRLHYFNPVIGKYQFQDGVGAMPLQFDKGSDKTNINNCKDNAVMLAAPAAESYAIKDAAEKIGNIFGANLNRKEQLSYTMNEEMQTDSVAGLKLMIQERLKKHPRKQEFIDRLIELENSGIDNIENLKLIYDELSN